MSVLIKMCGATTREDLRLLDDARVDLVGLWCGITGGKAELPVQVVTDLVSRSSAAGSPQAVLVTFQANVRILRETLNRTGARWIQLHGYQPPGVVGALKSCSPVTVVKALHLRGGRCLEQSLIRAYERAGTDLFLLDTMTEDGRIGSTGTRSAIGDVLAVAERLSVPFLIAGGVSADVREEYDQAVRHPLFRGVDIDTAARDGAGRLCGDRVSTIVRTWKAGP